MRNLKSAAAALTAAVLAVLATGCASDGDTDTAAGTAASSIVTAATSKAAASPRTATASPTAATPEAQRFERLLRATAPELYEGTFSSAHLLVGYGWITCEARRDGDSIDEAAAGITGRSLTSAQARAIVASAGIALCPQVT